MLPEKNYYGTGQQQRLFRAPRQEELQKEIQEAHGFQGNQGRAVNFSNWGKILT